MDFLEAIEKDYVDFIEIKNKSDKELQKKKGRIEKALNYKDKCYLQYTIDIKNKKKKFNLLEYDVFKIKSETVETEKRLNEMDVATKRIKEQIIKRTDKNNILIVDNKYLR